jgi:single-stranded-DNA-specific exonuclease
LAKHWTIQPPFADAAGLAAGLGVHPIVAGILGQRGYDTVEAGRAFLKPDLSQLHPPEALPGLTDAAERLVAAARDHEPIVIYGDYDVDGITAAAILWKALRLADANVRIYVPHRIEEGYGLNCEAVEHLAGEGAKVLVTVDCGISGQAEVARARDLGLDVIVTDHHEPDPDRLPPARAIVNPKLPDADYPFRDLAGAGVAMKLAWAIGKALSGRERVDEPFREFLIAATGLAALGTIADVVPLVGENHVLARFGLQALSASRHPGIAALREVGRLQGKAIDAYHIGYVIGPRLNAAGRLGHAGEAVELLTKAGPETAMEIAQELDRQNRRRREVEQEILEEADDQVAATFSPDRDAAIVAAGQGWHTGVIGIVASRLVEKYHRPTILIGLDEQQAQGSGRSIPGFHLFQALASCRDHLTTFGGHTMAAGLRLPAEAVGPFKEAFLAHAAKALTADDLTPRLKVDAEIDPTHITLETARVLDDLGPFGAGNPRPVFATRQIRVVGHPKRIGRRGAHLAMHVTSGGRARRCVGWRMGELADTVGRAETCGIAFTCRVSDYRPSRPEVELHLKDLWVGSYGDEAAAQEYA